MTLATQAVTGAGEVRAWVELRLRRRALVRGVVYSDSNDADGAANVLAVQSIKRR